MIKIPRVKIVHLGKMYCQPISIRYLLLGKTQSYFFLFVMSDIFWQYQFCIPFINYQSHSNFVVVVWTFEFWIRQHVPNTFWLQVLDMTSNSKTNLANFWLNKEVRQEYVVPCFGIDFYHIRNYKIISSSPFPLSLKRTCYMIIIYLGLTDDQNFQIR